MPMRFRIRGQDGNVLFMILLAVILFGALSFAVTRSNRAGGDARENADLTAAASVMDFANSVASAVTRMRLSGITDHDMLFNPPTSYSGTPKNEVFHPQGGGIGWSETVSNAVTDRTIDGWHYIQDKIDVAHIGSSAREPAVAVLTGIKEKVCAALNMKVTGSADIPMLNAPGDLADGSAHTIDGADIDGHAFLCVNAGTGYVYYHVLVEG